MQQARIREAAKLDFSNEVGCQIPNIGRRRVPSGTANYHFILYERTLAVNIMKVLNQFPLSADIPCCENDGVIDLVPGVSC